MAEISVFHNPTSQEALLVITLAIESQTDLLYSWTAVWAYTADTHRLSAWASSFFSSDWFSWEEQRRTTW